MQGNGVGDVGAALLAKAAQSPGSVLKHLSLSKNQVGDSGAMSLAAAISNPDNKLTTIWL